MNWYQGNSHFDCIKAKEFSNRKVALLLKIDHKTVNGYIKRFTELGITYEELYELCESDLNELSTKERQTEKQPYEELSALFPSFKKEKMINTILMVLVIGFTLKRFNHLSFLNVG